MMTELTRRQRDVLARLQELYTERGFPVRYEDLAQRLGINRFSAYDMLKVLERKGAVGSQYILSRMRGRPAVAFYPLAQAARQTLSRLSDGVEWEQVRERILDLVNQASSNERDILDDLLDDIPRSKSPLVYCGRVLTVLILSLSRRARDYGHSLLAATSPAEGLDLFAGLVLGLSLSEAEERRVGTQLVEYSQRCRQYIAEMDSASRDDLAGFVRQIVALRLS